MDNVLVNKASIVERCIKRINEEYIGHEAEFDTNFTRQDSIVLNLQRACEACLDIGTRLIRVKQLGVPQSSREVFTLLESDGIIDAQLSKTLQAMVGFRNIAVHDYRKLNLDIARQIISHSLADLSKFAETAIKLA